MIKKKVVIVVKNYLQMQQTPKPDAQVPSFVPPFVEHSSLEFWNLFWNHINQSVNSKPFFLSKLWYQILVFNLDMWFIVIYFLPLFIGSPSDFHYRIFDSKCNIFHITKHVPIWSFLTESCYGHKNSWVYP